MKKHKKLFILISAVLLICFAVLCYYLINIQTIHINNQCFTYVEEYLEQLPKDEAVLSEIDVTTQTFLEENVIEKPIFFTEFFKSYVYEKIFYEGPLDSDADSIKRKYLNEVVMLRLKVLAVKGEEPEYNKLFHEYIDDIEDCFYTSLTYKNYWYSEVAYPIEFSNSIYNIVILAYEKEIEACDDLKLKYLLLNDLAEFYAHFDNCEKEEEMCRKQISEIIKTNKEELRDILTLTQ